ncbi:MAG: hypothetical protein ACD_42C00235G0001 [uncultured bacterium]|nr:MAG: hypothetical protein ACD_42C00235G0001 [uncultured bacterium]OGT48359.1 MAG: MFS transporter [Gammaproteobacteria bacterium RIFCSPHIGHO2_12_FULL_39_24]
MPSFQRVQPWIVVFSASLFFFFEFMQVNMFNALDPSLYKAFHLSNATQLGQLSACYMYAIVLFLFPAGMILDRFPTRLIIIIAMFTCATCAFLFSFTTALWQAEICRLITGVGGAFCLLSCVRLASRWFPPKHMALVVGLIVTFAMLGGMMAQTPFTTLTEMVGWRNTLRFDAAAGFIMLLVIVAFVRDFPAGERTFFEAQHVSLEKIGFWRALRQTISNTQNWLGGLYTSLINLPIFLLGSTWGSWYLMQTQQLSAVDASFVTSMLFIGMIIGSPALGWFSDLIEQRKMPMMVGAVASIGVIFAIMYIPHLSLEELLILFFVLGFVISSQIISYALIAESNPSVLTGTAEGLASVLIMAGGFLIPVFPMLLNLHWNHVMQDGIPHYSLHDYHLAFLIMPIAFVLALFASFAIKETHTLSYEESCDGVKSEESINNAAVISS